MEFILTLLKFIPLLLVPLAALPYFDLNNFVIDPKISELPTLQALGKATLLTFWGFVGLECSTAAAGSVENPSKTIPRAVILGTTTVAVIYLLNSIGVMGLINGHELIGSKAPYVDATEKVFGGNMAIVISLIACLICIGTLNAWILVSGQIVLGLAESGLMPKAFASRNSNDAPSVGIIASSSGIIPLLFLTSNDSLAHQITLIIDFSVVAFLFVYLACCLAFFKIHFDLKEKITLLKLSYSLIATLFCGWVIFETPVNTLIIASLFTLSGAPLYFFWYRSCQKKPI
jgi:APA family basic amino acid/polyamine antiporter